MKVNLASTLGEFDPAPVMINAKDLFAHGIQEILGSFNEELLHNKSVIIDGFVPVGFVVTEIDLASISVAPFPVDHVLALSDPYAFLEEPEHVWPKIFRTRKSHKYIWRPVPGLDVMRYPGIQLGTFGSPIRVRPSYSFAVENQLADKGRFTIFKLFFQFVE